MLACCLLGVVLFGLLGIGNLGGGSRFMLGGDLGTRLGLNLVALALDAFSLACSSACCLIVLKLVSKISCNSFNCSSALVNSNSLIGTSFSYIYRYKKLGYFSNESYQVIRTILSYKQ